MYSGADPIQNERYEICRTLGEGKTAHVFLVRDRHRGGALLALKLIHSSDLRSELFTELEVLIAARHPNLAAVYDAELDTDRPYFTMEYVEGPDIATWARQRTQSEIINVLAGVLRALCLLHDRGWIHGDLKPANILVNARGQAKLVDLGLATHVGGAAGGTHGYLAPELLSGGQMTPLADIYSFGSVALEVLGGRRVFSEDALTALEEQARGEMAYAPVGIDAGIRELLSGCLSPIPRQRPRDVATLLHALSERSGLELAPDLTGLETLPQPLLVGRDQILDQARQHLQRAGERRGPAFLFLEGAMGLGKTRLLVEIRHLALRAGFPGSFRRACCSAYVVVWPMTGCLSPMRSGYGQWRGNGWARFRLSSEMPCSFLRSAPLWMHGYYLGRWLISTEKHCVACWIVD